MVFAFKFPDLGEGIHEGKIVKWLVKEGEVVKADQIMAEVETDKAVVELPSPASGTILKQYFSEGQTVTVGKILVAIGSPGEAVPEQEEAPTPAEHAKVVPLKPSEAHMLSPDEHKLHVTVQGDRPAHEQQVSPQSPTSTGAQAASGQVLATPATRALARELGVDLAQIKGSGPGGRVLPEDVKKFAESKGGAAAPQSTPSTAPTPPAAQQQIVVQTQPAYPQIVFPTEGVERVPATPLRKAIAQKMSESKRWIPHVTHLDEADVTRLEEIRQSAKKKLEEAGEGVKLTLFPFIAKAALNALKQFPEFNAGYDAERQEVVLKKFYNLGIAVDTPDGLIVVVLKDADKKGMMQLAKDTQALAEKARERKVSLEEVRGGTFTITNIGALGGTAATPIINFPESAILGVFRAKDRPVVVDGQVVVRKIMPLCVSFDHRIIDGAQAARFLSAIIKQLEDPALL